MEDVGAEFAFLTTKVPAHSARVAPLTTTSSGSDHLIVACLDVEVIVAPTTSPIAMFAPPPPVSISTQPAPVLYSNLSL